jgi:pSer/pThr/pTyr-binding forkhead associated (FHA) protein
MLAKLLERSASGAERHEIAITKEEFLIGRGADCDLRLRSKAVSRHHCLIRFQGGAVTLVELGSANGTFVNGQRIRSQAELKEGDEIGLGDFTFALELHGQSGVIWGSAADDPQARTIRVKDVKRGLEKDEGHPPGEAGGL